MGQEREPDGLCEELRRALEEELCAGNKVSETGSPWPTPCGPLVMLSVPFRLDGRVLPEGVFVAEVNDPHYWKAEYHCAQHPGPKVACRFEWQT
jgi:hypothetical protein